MNENKDTSVLINKKVLIIEDDVFLGGIFLRHMIDLHINAKLLTTGEGAIEAIRQDIPDIIILDILLPGMNGLDILVLIRGDATLSKIPVLVVSNTDNASDREKAKSLNSGFLLKALVSPDNIIDNMAEILKK